MSTTGDMDWSTLDAQARDKARADEAQVRRGFWPKLKRNMARIPFAEDAVTAYYAALDRETPMHVRAGLLGALAYFLMPADMVPDILPALGFGDDAAVLLGALKLLSTSISPHHRDAARATLDDMKAE